VNLISFSLWGTDLKYLVGAQKNADLAAEIYPEWVCRFYVAESVPYHFVSDLESRNNCQVFYRPGPGDWKSMFWRFEPAAEDNIDVMISRDTDSRLNTREKAAVDEWMATDRGFHIMRDHPWHQYPVLGGMWGIKKGTLPDMKELINSFAQQDEYGTDYKFFAEAVIPRVKDTCFVHDEFFAGRPFPTKRKGMQFVGQVFDQNDLTVEEHVHALRSHIE
jgi:protein O-GlcNAc transferase